MRVPLRRTGAVSCGLLIGSLVLARVIAPTGSRLLLALVFIVFVGAGVTLFAVVIAWSQASGDDIEAADPARVANRGVVAGTMRRLWRNVAAGAQRASHVWLSSAASIVTELASRPGRMVAVLRQDLTRDAARAVGSRRCGRLEWRATPRGQTARRRRAACPSPRGTWHARSPEAERSGGGYRDLHRGTRGVSPRPTGPPAHAKPIHWSLPAGAERQPEG